MNETGREAEMNNSNVSLLTLCETRWTQSGQVRLSSGETILYSDREEEDAHHTEGVVQILTKEAQRPHISLQAVSSRIITAKFRAKIKNINMAVVQCCAPTNEAEEEKKEDFYKEEDFYNRLQNVLDKQREEDLKLLMRNFDAKIGADNRGYEHVMGKHGLRWMKEDGELLADLCAFKDMVISGSIFPHKVIHKATWQSSDHVTENQIDHVRIVGSFRRSLQDVRVKRSADALSGHHLVMAALKLRWSDVQYRRTPEHITLINWRTWWGQQTGFA